MEIEIRHLQHSDKEFWYSLDKHLPESEFAYKVQTKRGYVMSLVWFLYGNNLTDIVADDKIFINNSYSYIIIRFWGIERNVYF